MKTFRLFAALLLGCLCVCGTSQTSFPMLGSVYPAGAERGKTTMVTVRAGGNGGANLYGAYKVLFTEAGITGEIVPPEKGWPAKDPKNPWTLPAVDSVQMKVTVAANVMPGIREFRLVTQRAGISSVGQLVIGDEPEVLETEPNNEIEKAQMVSVPCVVNGNLQSGEDVDSFKFKASAGQEIVFTALCARLQDKVHDLQEHADPLLVVRDLTGREVGRNDDYYRADPLTAIKFDKTGEYVVQIRDVNYKGNAHWPYRLTITTRPYVLAALPCAVLPGRTNELHVTGYNLGGAATAKIEVPANLPPGLWNAPLTFPNGTSNVIPLLVSDTPQTAIAREPNEAKTVLAANSPAPATPIMLPAAVNSCLRNARQIDRYAFAGKKGEAWGFEITARRLTSELDSELTIRNAKGTVVVSNDDTFGKDSRLEWTVPEDGAYTMEVRDLTGHGGPTYFYNLTVQALRPAFKLKCDCDRAMLAPGNRTTWYVLADRKNGFAGPIDVRVEGLPAGVSAAPLTIPAGLSVGTLFLTAALDAKIDAALVKVVGMAKVGNDTVTQTATPLTEIYMPGGGRGLLEAETQGVGVTEVNDLEVSANMQAVILKPGESAKIEITIKRRADYTKAVSIDALVQHLGQVFVNPLPPGITIEGATIPEKQDKGTITLKAAPDAKPIENLPIAIFANVSLNFVMKVWYAALPISLTVAVPPAKK